MKYLLSILVSFSAHAIDVKAGKHKVCALVMFKDKSPHLLFNPMSRNVLRVDLKGPKADEMIAKEMAGTHQVEFETKTAIHNKRSVEANLLSYSACEKLKTAVLHVGNDFAPMSKQ